MKTLTNRLVLAVVVLTLVVVGMYMNPRPPVAAAAGGPTVTIDPEQLPLPITGSTTVSGTVAATQSGAWNVGINGNTSGNPFFVRDTDNPAKQPFVSGCQVDLAIQFGCQFTAVPAGKEQVIEMFTVQIHMRTGNRPYTAEIVGVGNGTSYALDYPLSFNGAFNAITDIWAVQQPLTRAYADPGTTPNCFVGVQTGQGLSANCQISGYLINVP